MNYLAVPAKVTTAATAAACTSFGNGVCKSMQNATFPSLIFYFFLFFFGEEFTYQFRILIRSSTDFIKIW